MTKIDKASGDHQILRNLLCVKQYRNDKMPAAFEQVFLVRYCWYFEFLRKSSISVFFFHVWFE